MCNLFLWTGGISYDKIPVYDFEKMFVKYDSWNWNLNHPHIAPNISKVNKGSFFPSYHFFFLHPVFSYFLCFNIIAVAYRKPYICSRSCWWKMPMCVQCSVCEPPSAVCGKLIFSLRMFLCADHPYGLGVWAPSQEQCQPGSKLQVPGIERLLSLHSQGPSCKSITLWSKSPNTFCTNYKS